MKALFITFLITLGIFIWIVMSQLDEIYSKDSKTKRYVGGTGPIHYKGWGSESNSIETLLDRIEWTTLTNQRINWWQRSYIAAFIITFLLFIVLYPKIQETREYLIILLVSFVVMTALYGFYRFHADRFAPYYIRKDVQIIRNKLGLREYMDPLTPSQDQQPPTYNQLSNLIT